MNVYADNGATSFPKPLCVSTAIGRYIRNCGGSPSRGSYPKAIAAQELVITARCAIAQLFSMEQPKNVIFTSGATMSLNMLILGLAHKGTHFVTTSMEHNSVLRPLEQAKAMGAEYTIVYCEKDGSISAESIKKAIRLNTVAVVTTHASNVCGTILPIDEIGDICKEQKVFYIVDAAQTAGILPISMNNADAIAFAGHKALFGVAGIGGFAVSDALANAMSPTVFGGTGSVSHSLYMPTALPDRFEAGTTNMVGICGLLQGVNYVLSKGTDALFKKELSLAKILLQGFSRLDNIEILGKQDLINRTGIVAVNFKGFDNGDIAYMLSQRYGIDTRCGLHCAPLAHSTLGTFDTGCVRFSLNVFNTKAQAEYVVASVIELTQGQGL